jgi:Icc-related predicted phosphoesterase
VPRKFQFVAYGDIRFTDPSDTGVSNPAARRAIVERIAALKPAFVLMTGDLVLKGGSARDWKVWDAETKPLRDAGVPVFPVPGNHDLNGDPTMSNMASRFPMLKQRPWYMVRAGNVMCYMLNSDDDQPGNPQWFWLEQQLLAVPANVDFLVFVLHHPPYTRSANHMLGGGHGARPSEKRLATMLEQRQPQMRQRMIVIAGHVHNYERYEHGGVTYLVSGGGGATPYEVPRAPQDPYREPGPTYHFVRFFCAGHHLRAEMEKLELSAGQSQWAVKDSFALNAPAHVRSAAHGR